MKRFENMPTIAQLDYIEIEDLVSYLLFIDL